MPDTASNESIFVQFCPCGHFYKMYRSEVLALIGTQQLDDIDAGIKLDAPILPSSDCEDCQQERARQEQLCRTMGLDLLEDLID